MVCRFAQAKFAAAAHRPEICLPLGGGERRAGELAVGEDDAVPAKRRVHPLARSPCRPDGPSPREPEWISTVTCPSCKPKTSPAAGVEYPLDDLNLDEVVARSHGAELPRPARPGAVGDPSGVGARGGSRRTRSGRDRPRCRSRGARPAIAPLRSARGRAPRRARQAAPAVRYRPGRARDLVNQRARASRRARASSIGRASRRTPQLMSYPTPPGEITPSGGSVAATPPTGKP